MSEKLDRNLKAFLKHNKEGSFSTHANRSARLEQSMKKLGERFPHVHAVKDLKTKHIDYLVDTWKKEGLNAGTIKNRMSDLRWVSRKIDKQNIVKRTNDEYGIERRQFVNNDINKAKELDLQQLKNVTDPYTARSLQLQQAFGLRREEAIKINPRLADKGDHLALKDSWTKGGRPRNIPILTQEQRQLIDEVKNFCRENGATALIAPEKNYKEQLKTYTYQTTVRNDIRENHGLRHYYAQERYKELTGWECPKRGGMLSKEMTAQQRLTDEKARLTISSELGHNREEISRVYLGGK